MPEKGPTTTLDPVVSWRPYEGCRLFVNVNKSRLGGDNQIGPATRKRPGPWQTERNPLMQRQPNAEQASRLNRVRDTARTLERAKSEAHTAIRQAVDEGCTLREVAQAAGYRSPSSVSVLVGRRSDAR